MSPNTDTDTNTDMEIKEAEENKETWENKTAGPAAPGQLTLFAAPFAQLKHSADSRDLAEMKRIGLHAQRAPIFLQERFFLRCCFNHFFGRDPEAPLPEVRRLEHGKPYFAGRECYFNITHSGGSILILMCREQAVGLDAEILRPRRSLHSLVRKVMSAEERGQFAACAGRSEQEALEFFLLRWTHRECLLKHSGIGLAGLSDITLQDGAYRSPLNSRGTLRSYRLQEICPEQGFFTVFPSPGSALRAFRLQSPEDGTPYFAPLQLSSICAVEVNP